MTTTKAMKVKRTEWGYECSMSAGGRVLSVEIRKNEDILAGYYGRYSARVLGIRQGFDSLKSSKKCVENYLTNLLHSEEC